MFLDKKSYGAFVDESANLDDAMLECAVDVERAWGEMMLECCAMEFKAYQENGDVNAVNEGVIETIKNCRDDIDIVIADFDIEAGRSLGLLLCGAMKKEHPCKNNMFKIVRLGADIKIECIKCGRLIMLPRVEFNKKIKRVIKNV